MLPSLQNPCHNKIRCRNHFTFEDPQKGMLALFIAFPHSRNRSSSPEGWKVIPPKLRSLVRSHPPLAHHTHSHTHTTRTSGQGRPPHAAGLGGNDTPGTSAPDDAGVTHGSPRTSRAGVVRDPAPAALCCSHRKQPAKRSTTALHATLQGDTCVGSYMIPDATLSKATAPPHTLSIR